MTTHSNTPAGWYPDPHGAPRTLRYWDGAQWTQHTSPDQQAGAQAQQAPAQQAVPVQQAHQPAQAPHIPHQAGPDQRVQRQVQQQAGVAGGAAGGGTLFSEPVLVVNQKAKLIELTNEYKVMDQNGNQLGAVVQVGQSWFRKIVRFLYSIDQFMKIRLEIRDAYGQPVLLLTRPGKIFKSRVIVERPDGSPVGEIVQQNVFGKINFAMNVNGQQVGAIKAENWRAWNFAIVDHSGNEVARITKTWEGLAKTMFTTADNYVLQIHYQLPEPLLSLVVATALTVDTALKQDARGLG
ncbi:phospholipid scramblase-related protein [Streptomyces griseosporeus]|uniref:phospholipid scramblase-related protein n=1 Tax=Streptomyces griseosporeus TaxID=1910 RepID=UPI0036F925D8